MKAYRLYAVGRCGGFVDVIEDLFAEDEDAVAKARGCLGYRRAIEVWQQSRFVSRIELATSR